LGVDGDIGDGQSIINKRSLLKIIEAIFIVDGWRRNKRNVLVDQFWNHH